MGNCSAKKPSSKKPKVTKKESKDPDTTAINITLETKVKDLSFYHPTEEIIFMDNSFIKGILQEVEPKPQSHIETPFEKENEESIHINQDPTLNPPSFSDSIADKDYMNNYQGENLQFYLNKLQSRPNGDYVEVILKDWKGKYDLLEEHHGYVQWLFPNFYGSNFNDESIPLTQEEAKEFRSNPLIAERLVRAYELIYDFFGFEIMDYKTGEVRRGPHFEKRASETLFKGSHNLLRIRRILTSMYNVGFYRYAWSLVKFLEIEADEKKVKPTPTIQPKRATPPKKGPLEFLKDERIFQDYKKYGEAYHDDKRVLLSNYCILDIEEEISTSTYFQSLT
eukprot:TRINITY_DN19569_c0_g1_i1.p1 TRINITY_DN19569_c0_g1~~TRINITY_DN19569_c0_g1_i1.p1  ORF type:complete len:337 (+),score=65.40 TRINITY_DN19569_c0_g1_i1:137-1147(+)